jgi:dihydrofolate reductase
VLGVSVNGFIAKPDGAMDWLNTYNESLPDFGGFFTFLASQMVIGRKTFEVVARLEGGHWPYEGSPAVAITSGTNGDIFVPPHLADKDVELRRVVDV